MIKVSGYSDDLVEIEGDVRDEIDCYDQDVILAFDDGVKLKVHYSNLGIWEIHRLDDGPTAAVQIDLINRTAYRDGDKAYSDVATLKWSKSFTVEKVRWGK